MSEITVENLKVLCTNMFIQKALVAKLKAEKTTEEKILTAMTDEIVSTLEHLELKGFDTGFGKVSRTNKPYAKIVDKEALTAYMKKRGIYDDLITINATKMSAFYLEEMEAAKEEMNLDFKIDGMEVSSNRVGLSVTGVKL